MRRSTRRQLHLARTEAVGARLLLPEIQPPKSIDAQVAFALAMAAPVLSRPDLEDLARTIRASTEPWMLGSIDIVIDRLDEALSFRAAQL